MPSEVKVYSLWGGPVSSAVAGCKRNPNHSSAVPGGKPALFIVTLSAYRLLLLTLGHPALPGQT